MNYTDSVTSEENASLIGEVIIHKSRTRYWLHTIIGVLGLSLVVYTSFTEKEMFTLLSVLFFAGFLIFLILSVRNLLNRTIQIKMDQHSITFKDGTSYSWSQIKHVFIEKRNSIQIGRMASGSNSGLERYYLHIETTFSGNVTGYRTAKVVDITGLEFTPNQILRYIELYQRKYKS